MKTLELKIYPPVLLSLSLGLAYGLNHSLPILAMPSLFSKLHWYLGALDVLVILCGVWEFRKAKTTINPTKPEKTHYLVSSGIYHVTRNPMYLGMLLILVAAIFKINNYVGFIAIPFFVYYITQFRIRPEERVIERIFGKEYVNYNNKVRRWL
jgi:protein-S-isoprenylcysteine O-methyltransferase Ste14